MGGERCPVEAALVWDPTITVPGAPGQGRLSIWIRIPGILEAYGAILGDPNKADRMIDEIIDKLALCDGYKEDFQRIGLITRRDIVAKCPPKIISAILDLLQREVI